jgi:hypothetical protein
MKHAAHLVELHGLSSQLLSAKFHKAEPSGTIHGYTHHRRSGHRICTTPSHRHENDQTEFMFLSEATYKPRGACSEGAVMHGWAAHQQDVFTRDYPSALILKLLNPRHSQVNEYPGECWINKHCVTKRTAFCNNTLLLRQNILEAWAVRTQEGPRLL